MEGRMRAAMASLVVGFLSIAPVEGVEGLEVSFAEGRVTVIADQVPIATILDEWSRRGDTEFIDLASHVRQLPRQPLQISLIDVPEADALRVILRDAAGFIAAPRTADVAGASHFDRVLVMATSRAPTGGTTAPVASGTPAPPAAQRGPWVASPTDGSSPTQGVNESDAMESLRRVLPQPLGQSQAGQPSVDSPPPGGAAATAPRPGMPVASTDDAAPVFIRPVRPQTGDR